MSHLKLIALVSVLMIMPQNGITCGPDFPEELMPYRDLALKEPPPTFFSLEIKKLIDKPRTEFVVVENSAFDEAPQDLAAFEAKQFPKQTLQIIQRMRAAENGDVAYTLGAGLSEAVRLYTSGSVDFHRAFLPVEGEKVNDYYQAVPKDKVALNQASIRFQQVLKVTQERNAYTVMASYMLGRIAKHQGTAGLESNDPLASQYFSQTRQYVREGLPDPLGLAVASFAEEAYFNADLMQSTALYLQQLSYGSKQAEKSLKRLAYLITQSPSLLDEALQHPLTQRLLFLYLYSQHVGFPYNSMSRYVDHQQPPEPLTPEEQKQAQHDQAVWRKVVESLEKKGFDKVAGTDWLAAMAYSQGDFSLAQQFVKHDNSALSLWVQAKLALREGKSEQAVALYAQTIKAFPVANLDQNPKPLYDDCGGLGCWADSSLVYRVNTELGILQLARRDYISALSHLYAGADRYWMDAAYVAERVLTLKELKEFVDKTIPIPTAQAQQEATTTQHYPPAMRLRELLARRLMRAGRVSEAIAYFDNPTLRADAQTYDSLLQKTSSPWHDRIAKAEAWHDVAVISRTKGMELMGYEQDPDFAVWDGEFAPYYGEESGSELPKSPLVSSDEKQRLAANQANPNIRYHYRIVAANQAAKAADLLPRHSQAFAAVLCEATRWNIDSAPQYAHPFYKRYLHEGSYVKWGKDFGRVCPAPDFKQAEKRLWQERLTLFTDHPKRWGVASLAGFMMFFLGWWLRRGVRP